MALILFVKDMKKIYIIISLLIVVLFLAYLAYVSSENKCVIDINVNGVSVSKFKMDLAASNGPELGNRIKSILNDVDSDAFELKIDFSYIPEDYLVRMNRVHSIQYDKGHAVFIKLGMDPIPDIVQEDREFDSYEDFSIFCQNYLINCFEEFIQNIQPRK